MKLVPLERHTSFTALGIRFWDSVMMRPATGLRAVGQRLNGSKQRVGRRVVARPNQSGVEVFFGLHPGENTSQAIKEHALPPFNAVVEVSDRESYFVPAAFMVEIPHRRVFLGRPDLRPPGLGDNVGVPLFSTVRRPTPEGMTLLQGQLVVGAAHKPDPARFALVRVRVEELHPVPPTNGNGNQTFQPVQVSYYGLTDGEGRLKFPLPYPPIPTTTGKIPLREQAFSLKLQVLYDPAAQGNNPLPADVDLPNYASIFAQQPAQIATEYSPDPPDPADPETGQLTALTNELAVTVKFDVPTILRTVRQADASSEPHLRVLPPT